MLQEDFEELYASFKSSKSCSRIHRRVRQLEDEFDPVACHRASNPPEATRVLDCFIELVSERTRSLGIPNMFEDEEVRSFYRRIATSGHEEGTPALDLYWLAVGDEIAAIWGTADKQRFSGLVTTFNAKFDRYALGEILMRGMIEGLLQARPTLLRSRRRRGPIQKPVVHQQRSAL